MRGKEVFLNLFSRTVREFSAFNVSSSSVPLSTSIQVHVELPAENVDASFCDGIIAQAFPSVLQRLSMATLIRCGRFAWDTILFFVLCGAGCVS
jgi:hypothetical protein